MEARLLLRDKPERRPVESGIAACDAGDQPVPDHAHRWHRVACVLCLGNAQAHILEHEGQDEAVAKGLLRNLLPIDLISPSAEQSASHAVDEPMQLPPAL